MKNHYRDLSFCETTRMSKSRVHRYEDIEMIFGARD